MKSLIDIDELIDAQITASRLPTQYRTVIEAAVRPLARAMLDEVAARNSTFWVGLNGAQGTGKTTLLNFLQLFLKKHCRVVTLSLDDFYLGRSQRISLAENIHPLLETRGAPGTHDLDLLRHTIQALKEGNEVRLPRFDKGVDDQLPESLWERVCERADVVILEGWCVGCPPQSASQLVNPVNELEAREDPELIWRTFVNNALRDDYQPIFSELEQLIMLRAPSFDAIYRWRSEQEKALEEKTGRRFMDEVALLRFVQHYERITRHCLETLSLRADYVVNLNEEHQVDEFIKQ